MLVIQAIYVLIIFKKYLIFMLFSLTLKSLNLKFALGLQLIPTVGLQLIPTVG